MNDLATPISHSIELPEVPGAGVDWSKVPREVICSRPDWFAAWITHDDPAAMQYHVFEHVAYIANIVTRAIRKGRGRLIINMPPQHGKSWFLCRWLIVCYWNTGQTKESSPRRTPKT
ncbi:MAG: hypothetical protein JKX85_15965 [Phycisphaeraceae bacterium]|nr:hypothetical protein [Phycisphaeraceae bacterium]